MTSRPQTPIAMRQKLDFIDLTISPAPAEEFRIEEDAFQLDDSALSISEDTDIIQVGEELDSLLLVC
jgi:hypothetical protein